jgi:hypothetical protein
MKRKRDIKISKQYRKYNEYHRIENGIEQKQCEDCKEWLDMNSKNFGSAKGNKDGFNHKCRKCKKKHDREYYIENQEHIIETTKNWILNNQEQYYNYIFERGKNPSERRKKTLYNQSCKQKFKGYPKEWARNNKDKVKKYRLNREQHKTHEISKEDLEILYEYAESKCMYCDMTEEYSIYYYGEKLHKDHAYNNGSNGIDNCILACKSCNCTKHTKDWDEWFTPENPIYDEVNYNRIKAWLDIFKEV